MPKDSEQDILSRNNSLYVKTHCGTCAAGWVRRGADGEAHYWCLLDLAPSWPQMEYCSRYMPEQAESKPREAAVPVFVEAGDPDQKH